MVSFCFFVNFFLYFFGFFFTVFALFCVFFRARRLSVPFAHQMMPLLIISQSEI